MSCVAAMATKKHRKQGREIKSLKAPTGCGSAWLERLIWDQEVAGSNPVTPITCGKHVEQAMNVRV